MGTYLYAVIVWLLISIEGKVETIRFRWKVKIKPMLLALRGLITYQVTIQKNAKKLHEQIVTQNSIRRRRDKRAVACI